MKLTLLMLTCISMLGCAHSDPWTKRDTVLQLVYTATLAADARTTSRIQYTDGIREVGFAHFALGDQPATAETWQYFASAAIFHAVCTRALPAKWRPYWQSVSIAVQTRVVIGNCQIGLCR